jgi:hypothetical protein
MFNLRVKLKQKKINKRKNISKKMRVTLKKKQHKLLLNDEIKN